MIPDCYKCIKCGQKICDLHSPDSEEQQSKRHCPTCFENREETKRRKPKYNKYNKIIIIKYNLRNLLL